MFKSFVASSQPTILSKRIAAMACLALAFSVTGFTAGTESAMRDGKSAVVVPAKPALRVVAFGSSSTEGVGASAPSASYPAQLQAVLSRLLPKGKTVEVINRGIGGQDVDDMMQRLQADVLAPKPDVVIWQTGSNDALRHVPVERFEAETRDGIRAMQKAGADVILMEPQWCPTLEHSGNADIFRAAVRRIGEELNVVVIRRSDMMHKWIADGRMTRAQMLAPDGLHMADVGYAQLARDIAPEVLKAASLNPVAPVAIKTK